jgi:protoporphyrinogen/coproporphyrinogen III oxidase
MTVYDAVVVGAGIAGLACAERVAALGGRVLVLEREPRVGGMLRSDELDGFVVDRGPQTIRGADPALFGELDALGLERTPAEGSDARFILHGGKLVALPRSPLAFLRTPLLSSAGKARVLREPFVRRGTTPDESVDAFFRRRVGREVAERVVDPFVSGVHAGDPAELSMARVFPAVVAGERAYGSLAAWGLARALGRASAAPHSASDGRPEIFSFRGGLERWPAALADRLGDSVRTGVHVLGVERITEGWAVHWEGGSALARHVALAAPAAAAAAMLRQEDDPDLVALERVAYAPIATVSLGYRLQDIREAPRGFGVLIPAVEERPVLGILWLSSMFPGRSPEGTALTTTFIGGARRPDLVEMDDEVLVRMAHDEHQNLLGAHGEPVFSMVNRWPAAIPQHTCSGVDAEGAAGRIERRLAGLHLLGSYRAGGASVPACWQRGREVGANILHPSTTVG